MSSPLLIARHGPVLSLSFNRPARRNALTAEMGQLLTEALQGADRDPEVRVVVLSGQGGHFCSGVDLAAAVDGGDPSPDGRAELVKKLLVDSIHPAILALWNCGKPTIGALSGATVGIGLSVALACDLRIMAEDAYLATQFVLRGLLPDGGLLYQLERLCGLGRTLELTLRPDKRLTGMEAQAFGLSSKTVGSAALIEDAMALAQELTRGAPLAQRALKKLARGNDLPAALAAEVGPVTQCLTSTDAAEGAIAFFEKRAPVFTGQ